MRNDPARQKIANRERFILLTSAGLCLQCKADAMPGRRYCPVCAQANRERNRLAYRRRRAAAGFQATTTRRGRSRVEALPAPPTGL